MKLRDLRALLDVWPPEPGGAYKGSYVAPIDCLDSLQEVFLQRVVGSGVPGTAILTGYRGEEHSRDIHVRKDDFADRLVVFVAHADGQDDSGNR